ncbi:MAG: energy transducer TonB [FCB group bacterium]|nr:energy transducer TonB [FCB group bacterium]MBL7026968.1 energy transducer TonB [Candidatus Neomarinimicrobiota bacterium]MBL7122148.1 energy transducer TonB [Candidatus Neomarinimicrobiota bacterium]
MKAWMKSGLIILASALVLNALPMEAEIVTRPQPVGGIPAVCEQVIYPDLAVDMGLEGNVTLRFRVDEFGNVSNIQVIRSGGYLLDEAAMAAVSRTEWIPASHNNQNYSVLFQLPFKFCLD